MTMSQTLLPEFDLEMKNTRRALDRVPDDKFEWRPHEKSMTLGQLAAHIAELTGFMGAIITKDVLNFDKGDYSAPTVKNRADVLARLEKVAADTREAIVGATDDHLRVPWHMVYKGQKMFEMPRAAALRGSMNHLVHHRGQLTVYLRLNDVAVPGMYGASADEQ